MNFGPKDRAVRYTISCGLSLRTWLCDHTTHEYLTSAILGIAWGLLRILVDGYVLNGIGDNGWNHAGLQFR
jgi:hypothetical protein